MKKFGFLALLAAVLLVACKPQEKEVVVNSIRLNESSLTLSVGGEEYLKAITDPAGVEVKWTSSNTQVATVGASGHVYAKAEGEADIVATAGDKTATCHVSVAADALYDEFAFADWGLFGEFEEVAGTDTLIELSDGFYDCRLAAISFYAWGDGITLVNNRLSGAGLFAAGQTYVYVITTGDFAGYYVGSPAWYVEETNGEMVPYSIQRGVYDVPTYGKLMMAMYNEEAYEQWTDADGEEYSAKNYGMDFTYVDITNSDNSEDFPYGWINKAVLVDADEKQGTAAMWAADITWANLTAEDRYFGFKYDVDLLENEKIFELVKDEEGNYDFSTIHRVFDEYELFDQVELNEAPKYFLGDMNRYHKELPAFSGRNLDTKTLHKFNK